MDVMEDEVETTDSAIHGSISLVSTIITSLISSERLSTSVNNGYALST